MMKFGEAKSELEMKTAEQVDCNQKTRSQQNE